MGGSRAPPGARPLRGRARLLVPVLALAVVSVVSALIIVVIVMSRLASGHLVVDGDDVRVMTADFEHSLRRNAVVVGDESHMNEIHHIVIGKNDRFPLLARLLLVVTPGPAVRRPGSDSDGHVIDLGTDTVADRDVPPREPAHPHVHNGR